MDKRKKIPTLIACLVAGLAITALIISGVLDNIKKRKEEAAKKSAETVVSDTQNQIGGEIMGDGYYITYEQGKNRFIITITDEPFIDNQKKGEAYLKSRGVDLCKTEYLVLPSSGVTPPDNIVNSGC
jgi:hypothetical protein